MPLTLAQFLIGMAIVLGIPLAVFGLNRWRHPVGWFFLCGLIILFFVAHAIKRMTYGRSWIIHQANLRFPPKAAAEHRPEQTLGLSFACE